MARWIPAEEVALEKQLQEIQEEHSQKVARIAALEAAHDAAKSDADFQRVRCDAFYDVVGDYIDVTNQIKALDKAPY